MTFLIVVTWRMKVIWFGGDSFYYSDLEDVSLYFLIALAVPLGGAILIYLKEVSQVNVPVQHGIAAIFVSCFLFFFHL